MLAIGIYLGARLYGRGVVAPYVVAMIARVALDLPLRVWHARIAARGRVFRPPWIQVVIEAIGPLIVLALHSTAGRWTVLVSFVTASFASRVVMLVYVRRSYASHGYRWIGPRLAATRALPWFAIAGHAVAGIATRIPQMVGVALLAIHNLPSNIAVGLQLSIGVLTAATSWCWTHYHDLLPVQHAALYRFRRRIERSVQVESLIVGAIVGLATLAVVGWMTPREFIDPGNSDFIVLVPPTLPSPWPYAAMLPAVAIAMSWLSSMQVIAWTRDRLVAVTIGGGMIASVLTLAPRVAWWWHGGHGYHYDAPPSWLRSQQATLIAAMLVTGGLTLVWLRGARARVLRGRIAWIDGVVLARRGRDDVAVIGLARSGVLADRIGELSLTTGATWWARRERSILIAGMSRAAIADLAINTGGWIRSVRPWAEVEATASDGAMPVPRTDSITINIVDERAVMPPGMQLTRYQLSQLWSGLMAAMRGGATANVAVGGVVYRGDTIARCAVRLRA